MTFLLGQATDAGINAYRTLDTLARERDREARLRESHDVLMRTERVRADRAEREWADEQERRRTLEDAAKGQISESPDMTAAQSAPPPEQLGGPAVDQSTGEYTGEAIPFNNTPAAGSQEGGAQPKTLAMLGGGDGAQAAPSALPAQGAPAAPGMRPSEGSPSYRTMVAERDYWMKKDPAKAAKIEKDYYTNIVEMNELAYKIKVQPKVQELADAKRNLEEVATQGKIRDVATEQVKATVATEGAIYALAKRGNTEDAVRLFNASGLVAPGVKAQDIGIMQGPDGQPYVAFLDGPRDDPNSKPVKGPDGQAFVKPQAYFERELQRANEQDITMKPGERRTRVRTDPTTGETTSKVIAEGGTPVSELARRDRKEATDATRTAAEEREKTRREDRMAREAREQVRTQLFAGSRDFVTDTEKQAVHEKAGPLAEQYARSGVPPGEAAQRAISETRAARQKQKDAGVKPDSSVAPPSSSTKSLIDRWK